MKIIKRGVEDKTKVIHDKVWKLNQNMQKIKKIDKIIEDLLEKKRKLAEIKDQGMLKQKCRCNLTMTLSGRILESGEEQQPAQGGS
jgi:hypothetical protein